MVLTVARLAEKKRLVAGWLADAFGLRDSPKGVVIPYYLSDGSPGPEKLRAGEDSSSYRWPYGAPLTAYGLWRLSAWNGGGDLILVEGESDVWALARHGWQALGLPGANSARQTLYRNALDGFECVYIHQEPGDAGGRFVEGCLQALRVAKYEGRAFILTMPAGIKDPADLHASSPDGLAFQLAFRQRLYLADEVPPDAWLGAAPLRNLVAEALRSPNPWLRKLLVESLAEDVGKLVAGLLKKKGVVGA